MNDRLHLMEPQILAWLVVDRIDHPDLGPALHRLVEMPTATIQIRTETSDEGIEVQFHATTASAPFLQVQGAEAHRALFNQSMEVAIP